MGYRHYFYLLEKPLAKRIQRSTEETFTQWGHDVGIVEQFHDDDDAYVPLYKIGESFFEFGKYYDHAADIQKTGEPLFQDVTLAKRYEEYSPYIVGKEAVLKAIEHQQEIIINFYEGMLKRTDEERLEQDFDQRPREKMFEHHLTVMYQEWKNDFGIPFAIDLNESKEAITESSMYEYSIFELVRLYKSTDWDKYCLLFMGW